MKNQTSVSGLCFGQCDLGETLDRVEMLGATATTLSAGKVAANGWDAGMARLTDSPVGVAALIHSPIPLVDQRDWASARARLCEAIDVAAELGRSENDNAGLSAAAIYFPSGLRPSARWTECVSIFSDAYAPVVEHAVRQGVRLAVEPTNWLYSDLSFVHTLESATELARRSGLGLCMDLFHVWADPHLDQRIVEAISLTPLVQLSDYVFGDRCLPSRAVPGDGDLPLAQLLGWIGRAGYSGVIDLELSGPRIDAEGEFEAACRGLAALRDLLASLETAPAVAGAS